MDEMRETEKRYPSCYILALKFDFYLERRNVLNLEESEVNLYIN